MVTDLLQCMSFCEIVRILAVWKKHDLYVHALLEHQSYTPEGRFYTGSVAVIDDRDIVCELPDQTDLLDGERCAAGSHHIGDSELMHRKHIEISLDKDTSVLP